MPPKAVHDHTLSFKFMLLNCLGLQGSQSRGRWLLLSIIDLAGSERAAATTNMGQRMVEGANIKKSLLALGNCINALCGSGGAVRHVPYRNSKLTRLLKFSLGGNCKTIMTVCVAPTSNHWMTPITLSSTQNEQPKLKRKWLPGMWSTSIGMLVIIRSHQPPQLGNPRIEGETCRKT